MVKKFCIILIPLFLIKCIFCGIAIATSSNLKIYDLDLIWDKDAQSPFVRIFLSTNKPPELMLQLRYVVESAGGVVEWNSSRKTALINKKTLVVPGAFYCKY